MRMAFSSRVKRITRWVGNSIRNKAVILLYHRVMEPKNDPQLLCVTPDHFAQHMAILLHRAHPISLQQLIAASQKGYIPDRAVLVTFDDGYFDNLYNAKPVLEKFNIPATVFVAMGHIGNPQEFYWDELDRIFLQPGKLPERLALDISGVTHEWYLDEPDYNPDLARQYSGWSVVDRHNPTVRHKIYRKLCMILQPLPAPERQEVLLKLQAWASLTQTGRGSHRGMNESEIVQLRKGGLIEIGAHTITHPMLSSLPLENQQREIAGSKSRLEDILGETICSFSYPFGDKQHYSSISIGVARQAGFESACSNIPTTVWAGADPFQLPRMIVRDWPEDIFERQLSRMFFR